MDDIFCHHSLLVLVYNNYCILTLITLEKRKNLLNYLTDIFKESKIFINELIFLFFPSSLNSLCEFV